MGSTAHSGTNAATLELNANELDIGGPGAGTAAQLALLSSGVFSVAGSIFSVDGTPTLPTLITTDSWNNISPLLASFTAGNDLNGTSYPPQYRLTTDNAVEFRGVITTPSSGGVTILTCFVLPAAYRPSVNIASAIVVSRGGAQAGEIIIRPNGNLQFNGSFTNSNILQIDGCKVPLN
jgi:hypothetical protein